MDAVDSNILVYAHRADSPWHAPADRFVQHLAESRAPWAIPWPCLYEFYAIVTHPKIYRPATPPADALIQIDHWLESPTLVLLHEGERFWEALRPLVAKGGVRGGAVHDARVAALCLRHGVKVLHSADRDFSRFPGLRTSNPLRLA